MNYNNSINTFLEALITIKNTQGKKAKTLLLKKLITEHPSQFLCLQLALNPLFTTYLGEQAQKSQSDPLIGLDLKLEKKYGLNTVEKLIDLMQSLATEQIPRGHMALSLVLRLAQTVEDIDLRSVLMDILTCNLRLGINWNSFCKTAGIQKFELALANDINKVKNLDKKLNFPVYLQPKLDGYRGAAFGHEGWNLKSRNGKVYENFPNIVKALQEIGDPEDILDGEIMSDDFQSMQKIAFAKKRGTTVGDVKYYVFDHLQGNEWSRRACYRNFHIRYATLVEKYKDKHDLIRIVPTYKCNNWDDIKRYHKQFKEEGYEGSIIRMNVGYNWGRSDDLLKMKDMLSMDCKILSVEGGSGKYEDMMGALSVNQENNISCCVGTGFTDKMRKEFWEARDELIGKIIEIKYQELSPDGVMRFPVFIRFRDDKE